MSFVPGVTPILNLHSESLPTLNILGMTVHNIALLHYKLNTSSFNFFITTKCSIC